MDDSPPPFVVFYSPLPSQRAYRRTLELVEHIHRVLEHADTARYRIKDQLEHMTIELALGMSRAANEMRRLQWRIYRRMLNIVSDCATLIDVLGVKGVRADLLDPARDCARQLIAELQPLALHDN